MMGRQAVSEQLFYDFCLDDHAPTCHRGAGIVSMILGYRLFCLGVGGALGADRRRQVHDRIIAGGSSILIEERGARNRLCVVRCHLDYRHADPKRPSGHTEFGADFRRQREQEHGD